MVVYNAQGQFTYNPSYQGQSPFLVFDGQAELTGAGIPNHAYNWQTLGNAISFITGLIAALLYGNIGVKVFYSAVLRDIFKFPPLDKKAGKWAWVVISKCLFTVSPILQRAVLTSTFT
jgi:hypothetical protein